jgi:hypothetical protein
MKESKDIYILKIAVDFVLAYGCVCWKCLETKTVGGFHKIIVSNTRG